LKPFADRAGAANSAQSLIARVFAEGQQVRTATVIPFNLPPIIGLSTTGGFEYELEGLEGQDPAAMNSVMQGLLAAANQDPRLTRVFSTYTASNPSIYLDIDREKAQALGLGMNDVFGALQRRWAASTSTISIFSGGSGRSIFRARRPTARDVSSLWQIYIRNKYGGDVPMRSIANARVIVGPQVITRYNKLSCDPNSGGAISRHVVRHCARGDGTGLREDFARRLQLRVDRNRLSGGRGLGADRAILGLAVMFAFCFSSDSMKAG